MDSELAIQHMVKVDFVDKICNAIENNQQSIDI